MISPELLAILRCPMDPSRTTLTVEQAGGVEQLVCSRCRVIFAMSDGFPSMLIEDAQLPPGCTGIEQLPCQREAKQ